VNNAGIARTGSVSIPYASTAHDVAVATVAPSGQVTAELNQGTQVATVTFTSNDGALITNLIVTSGLSALPADWSGPGTFSCGSVSTGNRCQLALQFSPKSSADNGTIALGYSYVDDAGSAQTGSVNIPYTAVPYYLYPASEAGRIQRCAASFTDGSLSGCIVVASAFARPYGLAFAGSIAFIPDSSAGTVSACPVNADGTFGTCAVATAPGANPFTSPQAVAVSGTELYVTDSNGATPVTACTIGAGGALGNCFTTAWSVPSPLNVPDGIAIAAASNGNTYAYIVDYNGGHLSTCTVNGAGGALTNCTQSAIGPTPTGVGVFNGNLYVGTGANTGGNLRCPIAADGSVTASSCVATAAAVGFAQVVGFAFDGGYAYLSGYGGRTSGVYVCPVTAATGNLDTCTLSGDPLLQNQNQFGIAAH
jgi:hypothetical protein